MYRVKLSMSNIHFKYLLLFYIIFVFNNEKKNNNNVKKKVLWYCILTVCS